MKRTVLAVGEGDTEAAFLQYLRDCFEASELEIHVKIVSAFGGSPKSILDHAIKRGPRNYDRAFVLLDRDVRWPDSVVAKARRYGLELIGAQPCIEGLFLAILNPGKAMQTSRQQHANASFTGTIWTRNGSLCLANMQSSSPFRCCRRQDSFGPNWTNCLT